MTPPKNMDEDELRCVYCHVPIPKHSPSDDFCCEAHQNAWYWRRWERTSDVIIRGED